MNTLTIEQCSRVFEKVGLFVTQEGVKALCMKGYLDVKKRDNDDRRYSKYPFRVDLLSLVHYLELDRHIPFSSIKLALPEEVTITPTE
jgi:hypothetical protein